MYSNLTTFEHFYNSYLWRGKRKEKTTILFLMNLSKNIWDIQQAQTQKTFTFGEYYKFFIYGPITLQRLSALMRIYFKTYGTDGYILKYDIRKYFQNIDQLIKENCRVKYYSRYMDDGIIFHQDKKYLKEVLKQLKQELKKLGLECNEKIAIMTVKRFRTSAKKRYQRNMKQLAYDYNKVRINLEDALQKRIVSNIVFSRGGIGI